MRLSRREVLLSTLSFAAWSACSRRSENAANRCAFCGMRIARDSHWQAGGRDAAGSEVHFDTPGCLFRFRASPRGAGLRDAWVTEYYGAAGAHTPASNVRYVVGSDVVGPMGPDLIPIDSTRVENFVRDHHGHAIAFDEITPAVLQAL